MRTSIDVFAKAREHERLEQLRAARELDLMPYFRVLEGPTLPVVEMEGLRRIMLGSNNYLGLTGDERVRQGALDALSRYGTGLTGIVSSTGRPTCILSSRRSSPTGSGPRRRSFSPPGTRRTSGALGTILGPGDTVVADSGDHASILDGCILSRAKLRAFRHNRLDRLERTLEKAAGDGGGVLVVVDGVFSMEGDVAPLPEICELVRALRRAADGRRGARAGSARAGAAPAASELFGVEDRVDLRMATFSKSLASCGGVIAGPADVIEFLRISRGRSCSPPPRCRQRSARRWRRFGSAARPKGRSCSPACSRTLAICTGGSSELGFHVVVSRPGWPTGPR